MSKSMVTSRVTTRYDKKLPLHERCKWKIDINEPCIQNMLDAIDADRTKFNYLWGLQRYSHHYLKVSKVAEILDGSPEEIEDKIIQYIRHMKAVEKLASPAIRSARIGPLRKFYRNNRKTLNWDFIFEKIGKTATKNKDVAYTHEQIRDMLNGADERDTVVILALCSTGMRRGALPLLTFGDLTPLDRWGIYAIKVYAGEEEEYVTYCTPEFRRALDAYRKFRERLGEVITDKSPLFRKGWNVRDREEAVNNVLPVNEDTIYDIVEARAVRSGVRVPNTAKVDEEGNPLPSISKLRHKNKMVHGMRKFFEVTLSNAGFDEKWLDMIEGHKLEGLRGNYYRPANADDIVLQGTVNMDGRNRKPGFLELMGELTISKEARLERRLETTKVEAGRLEEKAIEDRMKKLLEERLSPEQLAAHIMAATAQFWQKQQTENQPK